MALTSSSEKPKYSLKGTLVTDMEIVQSGKDAFFRHPQTSGEHSEIKMFVGF